jgi:hypothetical protein
MKGNVPAARAPFWVRWFLLRSESWESDARARIVRLLQALTVKSQDDVEYFTTIAGFVADSPEIVGDIKEDEDGRIAFTMPSFLAYLAWLKKKGIHDQAASDAAHRNAAALCFKIQSPNN